MLITVRIKNSAGTTLASVSGNDIAEIYLEPAAEVHSYTLHGIDDDGRDISDTFTAASESGSMRLVGGTPTAPNYGIPVLNLGIHIKGNFDTDLNYIERYTRTTSIVLYSNRSEKIRLDKSLRREDTLSGVIQTPCDITDPTIIVRLSSVPTLINYLYISDFGRYYFITKPTALGNNLYQFDCHVDVLSSFKTEIRACSGIVSRSQSAPTPLIANGLVPAKIRHTYDYRKADWLVGIDDPLDIDGKKTDKRYVLITVGG